jgi:hypothetical protein
MFALDVAHVGASTTGSTNGDAGVFVTISSGNLNLDTITYDNAYGSYLGKTDYPFVSNSYPRVSLTVKPATSGDGLLGMTLNQTAQTDENGEKLLYYPQKAAELQAVLPGQAVPIATKGFFTIVSGAYTGPIAIGTGLKLPSGVSGVLTGCLITDPTRVAIVMATGSRTPLSSIPDQFAGTGTSAYAIIALGI